MTSSKVFFKVVVFGSDCVLRSILYKYGINTRYIKIGHKGF